MSHDHFANPFTPFRVEPDSHLDTPRKGPVTLAEKPFSYIGTPLTLPLFVNYIQSYKFGSVPPDSVVLHHTAIPSASWARYPHGAVWDAGESGLGRQAIREKRRKQLAGIKRFYEGKGWESGPHLFIDERYIWLFTPMYDVGTHARGGNSWRVGGRLHYSIGIEVIGYYEKKTWPDPVARLVGGAIAALYRQLGTFEIAHKVGPGGISSHRDYGKPSCPGKAITEPYYLNVIKESLRYGSNQ